MSNSPEIHIVPRKKCNSFFLRSFSVCPPGPIPHALYKIYRVCLHSLTALLFWYSVTMNYSSTGSFLVPVMLFLSPMLGKKSFKYSLIVFLAADSADIKAGTSSLCSPAVKHLVFKSSLIERATFARADLHPCSS